jgi:hypothetical protein
MGRGGGHFSVSCVNIHFWFTNPRARVEKSVKSSCHHDHRLASGPLGRWATGDNQDELELPLDAKYTAQHRVILYGRQSRQRSDSESLPPASTVAVPRQRWESSTVRQ